MIRPVFLRTLCALLAILITTAVHAKIRPGDEERLLKVAGEIIARQNAFTSMKLQLVEHGTFQNSQARAEWTVWIDGGNLATEKKRMVTLPDDEIQQEFSRSIRTDNFFVFANLSSAPGRASAVWYELREGTVPEKFKRAVSMHAPPNPLLDTTRFNEENTTDLQELLINSTAFWQIDDKADAEGIVVITRTTPKGQLLDLFAVDTRRGYYIVEHNNFGRAGVQRRRTATLKQFGDVWFPAATTLEYSSGSINSITCVDAQFDQPIPPKQFELTSLGCADGALLPHHYIDGRREMHICVEGVFFNLRTARSPAK